MESPAVVEPPRALKLVRVAHGWRQVDLAATAGVTRETVCRIERGHERPQLETAQALARALGHNVEDLFNDERPAATPGVVTTSAGQGRHAEE